MNKPALQSRKQLSHAIGLHRHVPRRQHFVWDAFIPSQVRKAQDLPSYLILGALDHSSFKVSSDGWSATWLGTEADTHFDVTYHRGESQYDIRQTWRGIDGGYSICSEGVGLNNFILRAMYMRFPSQWDHQAKEFLEAKYQMTYIEQPENMATFCGMPDGALRTIAFPVAVRNLEVLRNWLSEISSESEVAYPFSADARLMMQVTNYVEGSAPSWTTNPLAVFEKSLNDTGLQPLQLPIRETAADGTSAWTLHRKLYVVFLSAPFAGLTDLIGRLCMINGPIRLRKGDELGIELQPIVFPGGFDVQAQSVNHWDKKRSTRTTLVFSSKDDGSQSMAMAAVLQSPEKSSELINLAKNIGSELACHEALSFVG